MAETQCPKCGINVIEKQKKNGDGTFKVNLDGSYHEIPVTQPDGSTKWYHVSSKEHGEWAKAHNGPSGFVQPQSVQTNTANVSNYIPQTNELEAVLPPKEEDQEIDEAERIVLKIFVKANQMVRNIYPNLKTDSNTFGQIRSKFADQLLATYNNAKIVAELDHNV